MFTSVEAEISLESKGFFFYNSMIQYCAIVEHYIKDLNKTFKLSIVSLQHSCIKDKTISC